jgi:hypothetical protein
LKMKVLWFFETSGTTGHWSGITSQNILILKYSLLKIGALLLCLCILNCRICKRLNVVMGFCDLYYNLSIATLCVAVCVCVRACTDILEQVVCFLTQFGKSKFHILHCCIRSSGPTLRMFSSILLLWLVLP